MNDPARALTPSDEMRVFGGVVIQPVVAGCLAYAVFPLLFLRPGGRTLDGGHVSNVNDAALAVALGASIVASVVALFVVPVAVWVMKRRDLVLREALMFGLAFANVPYVLSAIAAGGTYGVPGLLRGVLFSSLLGLAGSAVFWAIAIRSRTLRQRGTVV
jgi:hypothetical protein